MDKKLMLYILALRLFTTRNTLKMIESLSNEKVEDVIAMTIGTTQERLLTALCVEFEVLDEVEEIVNKIQKYYANEGGLDDQSTQLIFEAAKRIL